MRRNHKLRPNGPALVGILLLLAFIVFAIGGTAVAPVNPLQPDLANRLLPPAWVDGGTTKYLLGTDQLGRDILSRLFVGSRIAILVGLLGVGLALTIGVVLGVISGYFGGWIDSLIMRITDTLVAIPNVILYLTVLGVFGPSLGLLVAVVGFINWTTFARVVRGEVLAVRELEHVEAARANGQRTAAIIVKQVAPLIVAPIVVVATLNVAAVVILEASLSFLGLGVQPPTVTWGRMLADGRQLLATAWWVASFPGVFITLLSLSLILIGDWLRDVLDPRSS